ncbi:uncharacterized protein LTR77_005944 [Saxophila tyrrhenica]|uniref:Uncharacterized protein n=1 Tax=Saxophila tyrrhenica TaxID=1690608 RepID=A0AAV9PAP4_9PEZI|nr:hypothetical protein LTR77_005944 [Saxophila tyrrhenica]
MARPRPSLSIDLSSFEPYGRNEQEQLPTTPDQRDEQQPATDPPPPPRPQPFKLRRRRAPLAPLPETTLLPEFEGAIPTIEMSEAVSELSSPDLPPMTPSDGLLAPMPAFQRLTTPKTPAPKADDFSQDSSPVHEWALITDSRDNKRPAFQRSGSVCSSFSDSSVSSCGSSAFSAPNNGSCTSPESVATDPFTEDDINKHDSFKLSQDTDPATPSAKRVKRHRHVKWTPEMDQHLESTYIMYLRDPRVTPFKTLPGIPPPLGVCSRVASKARRTWSQHRNITPTSLDTILESGRSAREGSPDTIRPDTIEARLHRQPVSWPSDAATRRRLRKLVKGKPQLSAHYQRLLRTRSPSPFASSSAPSRSSEPSSSSFKSHEMKMSLITSTASSMQPEGPLAQLSSDDTAKEETQVRPQSRRTSRPSDWFGRIGRSHAHQKSLSLQSELNLDHDITQSSGLLASPFDEGPARTHLLQSMTATKSLGRSEFNGKGRKVPSLDSPIELTGAPTAPRSLKRRFKSDEEKPRRPVLADVFGPPSEESGNLRNRGFTVGAHRASDNLTRIFEPSVFEPPAAPTVSSPDHEMTEAPPTSDLSHLGPIGSRSAPRRLAEPIPRLGSPFMETPLSRGLFNTFPRSYVPTASKPQPFQERLRELAAQNQNQNQQD